MLQATQGFLHDNKQHFSKFQAGVAKNRIQPPATLYILDTTIATH